MEEMELLYFQIIATNGDAKSKYIEALQEAKKGEYLRSEQLIKEADISSIEGHKIHAQLLAKEAAGEKTDINLILMHAEDQAMSTEVIRFVVTEYIELYKKLDEK